METITPPKEVEKGSLAGEYYSPSFISMWCACPAKTMLTYLSPRKQNNIYTSSGSAIHMFLEWYFNEFEEEIKEKSKSNSSLISYRVDVSQYKDKLDEFIEQCAEEEQLTPANRTKMVERAYKFVENGLVLTIPTNIKECKTEHTIIKDVSVYGVKLPKLKGIVDRADILENGTCQITDYKTSTKDLDLTGATNKFGEQTTIYNWLVNDGDITSPVNVQYITHKGTGFFKLPQPTQEQQLNLANKIVEVDNQVRQCLIEKQYPKGHINTGLSCDDYWCPFKDICQCGFQANHA